MHTTQTFSWANVVNVYTLFSKQWHPNKYHSPPSTAENTIMGSRPGDVLKVVYVYVLIRIK